MESDTSNTLGFWEKNSIKSIPSRPRKMNENKLYGSTSADKTTKKANDCRDIVKAIVQFGIDDQQILTVIRLLALEMEDYNACVQIVETLKGIGNSCFLIEEHPDGTKTQ